MLGRKRIIKNENNVKKKGGSKEIKRKVSKQSKKISKQTKKTSKQTKKNI